MKTPSPKGKYYYKTDDECLVVIEYTNDGWLWSVSEKDSSTLRIGAHWPSKGRSLEDVERALKETGHPQKLTQIGAQYLYYFDDFTVDVRGSGKSWRWRCKGKGAVAKTKSAALAAAVKVGKCSPKKKG